MTERVDFYLLKGSGAEARKSFSCRITQKAWQSGKQVFVQVADGKSATEMDELLWSFSQQSFIPHAVATSAEASTAPVVIGPDPKFDQSRDSSKDVLISLIDTIPETFDQFERVIEIVDADPQSKKYARERFRQYRERGVEPNTHNVS